MGEDQAVANRAGETAVDVENRLIRVLAIDDEPGTLELITHALTREQGYEVFTARNGVEGLQAYERERPDCVIVDVQMPLMSGFQFLRVLRGDHSSAQTPVIILSCLGGDEHLEAGELSGVDLYLQKPFAVGRLGANIRRVMCITPEERERRQQRLAEELGADHPEAASGEEPSVGLPD